MKKLLDQLSTLLKETNVEVSKIEIEYLKYDSVAIRINEEAFIKFSPNHPVPDYKYSVFSEDSSYSTSSLTEALERLVQLLNENKELTRLQYLTKEIAQYDNSSYHEALYTIANIIHSPRIDRRKMEVLNEFKNILN